MSNRDYLNNKDFLRAFDLEPYRDQYVRITVLDFVTEEPIASLEGKATSGSCNINGSSNMRRTASCSLAVDYNGIQRIGYSTTEQYFDITNVENLISINKKVKMEIGCTNILTNVDEWQQYNLYDILWFPVGVYVIKNASISKNNGGVNISLTLNDKTALINGDVGGVIPAGTIFSESELYNASGTSKTVEKVLIKDMIRQLVVDFGGERAENVLIQDIPDSILKVMKWIGKKPVYLIVTPEKKKMSMTKPQAADNLSYTEIVYGQDIGYMTEPFVYPGTLECNAGESVAAVLDKIKNALGNFEWFYDVEGRFVFREIKNYLNTSKATELLNLTRNDYISEPNLSTTVYNFDESTSKLITSLSSSPQFPNIKNDFIVWGVTKTVTGADKPIRYRLAFEDKPSISTQGRLALVYTDYRKLQAVMPLTVKVGNGPGNIVLNTIPEDGSDRKLYYCKTDEDGKNIIYHWDEERECFREYPDYEICYLKTTDWRTELYFQGLWDSGKVFAQKPYAAELQSEWPKIYDVRGGGTATGTQNGFPVYTGSYRTDTQESGYEYWLDFIEGSQFNINKIGRRTKVLSDNSVNCLFPSEMPQYIYIEANGDVEKTKRDAEGRNLEIIQVAPEIFKQMALGGSQSSAFDKIKELMQVHTTYNESISLSIIPIFYLEPNSLINIYDNKMGVSGNYQIKSISLPFAPNGTSNISATKIVAKTF